jgi:probable F420-dependent oxidoreductase
MKFGTNIMGVGFRHLADVATAFDELGFESVWVPEHLVFPADAPTNYPLTINGAPPFTPDTPTYDAWVVLAYIAAATRRIRLGTNVYILPLRHPLQTARSVVTLDRLSNGRAILGVGVGWLAAEFESVGLGFADRGRRTDAAIDVIRALWTEDVIEVHDEHFDFGPVKFQPKPLQRPSIPIEVGGYAKPALRRAGARGDGWVEIGSTSIDDFRAKVDVVLQARADAGRTGHFEITVGGALANDPANYEALATAGATRILVDARFTMGPRLDADQLIAWATAFSDAHIDETFP